MTFNAKAQLKKTQLFYSRVFVLVNILTLTEKLKNSDNLNVITSH